MTPLQPVMRCEGRHQSAALGGAETRWRGWLLFWPLDYDTPRENKCPRTVPELSQNWECGVLDLHMLKIRRNSWVGWCANVTIFCIQLVCNYTHFVSTLYPNWLAYQKAVLKKCWISAIAFPSKFSVIRDLDIYFFCLQIFLHRQELQEFPCLV